MTNIAVFASGRGTNFKNLIDAQNSGFLPGKIALLVAAKEGIGAIETARTYQVPYHVYDGNQTSTSQTSLIPVLNAFHIDFIALAGWLKYIQADLLTRYKQRIVNIHPALLPFFGGSGMYGMNVHRAVWASGMKVSGATVHFVDEQYDHGIIIYQQAIHLEPMDSPQRIAEKVLKVEHNIYPRAIKMVLNGNYEISGNRFIPGPLETE